VLAAARSIITLGVSYAVPASDELRVGNAECPDRRRLRWGNCALCPFCGLSRCGGRAAQGADGIVNRLGGGATRSLWYVDTGPLLERDLAQRAGLGFIGKHTNLISRKLGNWFFLAEIITTLELPPDAPEKNRCGSCRRCLEACPTAAITAPFQLDARRCISYLTIELKGAIPVEWRAAVGNRIYGCDDCLAACPWNRFARAGAMMAEHRRAGLEAPDLVELLSLDEAGFQARFAGTPLCGPGGAAFCATFAWPWGMSGDVRALPALQRAASRPGTADRGTRLWAIGIYHFAFCISVRFPLAITGRGGLRFEAFGRG
jgi:epoxyqueuosine reductase